MAASEMRELKSLRKSKKGTVGRVLVDDVVNCLEGKYWFL